MLSCFTACAGHGRRKAALPASTAITEKQPFYQDEPYKTRQKTIDEVMAMIRSADLSPKELSTKVQDTIHAQGWWDELAARAVLSGIWQLIVTHAGEWSSTFKSTLDKAIDEAKKIEELAVDFADEHPILTTAVVAILAIGVLYLCWPAALELLGFGAEGPIEGESLGGNFYVVKRMKG
jgi:hypothetical protein